MSLTAKSKRKIIINVAIVLVVTLFAVYYLTKSNVITLDAIRNIRWWNYLVVCLCFFGSLALLSLVDFFIYRSFTKTMPYGKCLVNTISGNLGSGVTPFKSGHFPLMVYYQYNSGVPVNDTAVGLVKCQIIYSATSIVLYTAIVITLAIGGYTITFYNNTIQLWIVVSLGLFFHLLVFTAIVILSYNQKLQEKILKLWAKFLKKIKKIEDENEYLLQKSEKFKIYREQLGIIGKSFHKYIVPSLIYAVNMLLLGSIQYISYLLITGSAFSIGQLFGFYTLTLASQYITNIIPVPGGVGTSEVLFTLVFAFVIPDTALGSVLVLWRMGTYYIPIIIATVVFSIFIFVRKRPKKQTENL